MIDPNRNGKRHFGPVGALAVIVLLLAIIALPIGWMLTW